jgi:hypothetical protein
LSKAQYAFRAADLRRFVNAAFHEAQALGTALAAVTIDPRSGCFSASFGPPPLLPPLPSISKPRKKPPPPAAPSNTRARNGRAAPTQQI